MKPPRAGHAVLPGDSSPAVVGVGSGKPAVKEGHVSKIASRFQKCDQKGDTVYRRPEPLSLMTKPSRPSLDGGGAEARKRSVVEQEEEKAAAYKRPVSRTESHQTRFNNARAMFEKMGSAEELDNATGPSSSSSAQPVTRASSVGRPAAPSSALSASNGESQRQFRPGSRGSNEDTELSFNKSAAFFRSRSTSPSAAAAGPDNGTPRSGRTPRSPKKTSLPAFPSSAATTTSSTPSASSSAASPRADSSSAVLSHSSSYQNGIAEATTGLVKSRRLSFQQKGEAATASGDAASSKESSKASTESGVGNSKPNVKELTSKQRNWFPSFERGASSGGSAPSNNEAESRGSEAEMTSVESSRRESVKHDNVPQTIAGLDQPGDRRPLGARNSSDSIEDYIRNWKKTSPTAETAATEQKPANDESR